MGILETLGKTAISVKPDSEIHGGYPQVIRTLTTAGHQRCDFLENQNSGNRGGYHRFCASWAKRKQVALQSQMSSCLSLFEFCVLGWAQTCFEPYH